VRIPVTEEAHVGHVQLRCLHQSLAQAGVVGPQQEDLVGGLEDGEPRLRGVDRHAQTPGDVREIEELRAAGRHGAKDALELDEVAHLAERSDSTTTGNSRAARRSLPSSERGM
jgi:hypothetical protein